MDQKRHSIRPGYNELPTEIEVDISENKDRESEVKKRPGLLRRCSQRILSMTKRRQSLVPATTDELLPLSVTRGTRIEQLVQKPKEVVGPLSKRTNIIERCDTVPPPLPNESLVDSRKTKHQRHVSLPLLAHPNSNGENRGVVEVDSHSLRETKSNRRVTFHESAWLKRSLSQTSQSVRGRLEKIKGSNPLKRLSKGPLGYGVFPDFELPADLEVSAGLETLPDMGDFSHLETLREGEDRFDFRAYFAHHVLPCLETTDDDDDDLYYGSHNFHRLPYINVDVDVDGPPEPTMKQPGNSAKALEGVQKGPRESHAPQQNKLSSSSRGKAAAATAFNKAPEGLKAAAWRSGKRANKEVIVPDHPAVRLPFAEYAAVADSLGGKSGAYVAVTTKYRRVVFQFFGEPEEVELAFQEYKGWYTKMTGDRVSGQGQWPGLTAFKPKDSMETEIEFQKAASKAVFKQNPPPGMAFPFTHIVLWPASCVGLNLQPRDVFGNYLEALDSIRMESEVYITLVTRITDGQPALRIMGSNEANAATAFRHLENLMVQIEGRFFEVQTLNVCLDGIGGQVALLKYDNGANELTGFSPKLQWPKGPGPKQRNATVDQSMLAGLMGDDRLILIERQIARSLNGIRRQKKVFSMNVHLGLFVLTKGIPGGMRAFSHNDFLRMMENTDGGIEAFVTRASGQERGSFDIRPRLTSAGNFLTPVGEASGDLAKVRPVYRGKFILENSLEPGRNYLLQVEFRIDEEGDVTQLPAKWSEFEAGKILPTQFLDVNLVDLADGRACHFGLEGTIPIVEALVPVHLQAFSDSITLYRHVAEVLRHDTPFLYWLPYRNMNIKQVTLERVFTYQIRNTGFLVEASHTTVGGLGWWWSVDVRHSDWPMHLVQLEKLKPGREANWSDAVKLFFPDDGMTCYTTLVDLVSEGGSGPSAGLRLFVNKLICLSNILARRSVTVDGQPQFSTYPPVGLLDL